MNQSFYIFSFAGIKNNLLGISETHSVCIFVCGIMSVCVCVCTPACAHRNVPACRQAPTPIPHLDGVKEQHATAAGEQVLPEQNAVVKESKVPPPLLPLLAPPPDHHPPADSALQLRPQQQQGGDHCEEDGSCESVQCDEESWYEVVGEVTMETGEG